MAATFDDIQDARRYRWLVRNCLREVPASRDGPEYPELRFYFQLYEYYVNKQPLTKDLIDAEIDKRMERST